MASRTNLAQQALAHVHLFHIRWNQFRQVTPGLERKALKEHAVSMVNHDRVLSGRNLVIA